MKIIKVLLPLVNLFPLIFKISDDLEVQIGDLVVVEFRKKQITGIIWQEAEDIEYSFKIKSIHSKDAFNLRLNNHICELVNKASNYYLCELGTVAKLVLPVEINENPIKIRDQVLPEKFNLAPLSKEQAICLASIEESSVPIVLKGITGSGKTEIYFHLLAKYLLQGKQVLIMLPEIALSSQIINRFKKRFGFDAVIWNSSITKPQKKAALRGILTGEVKIVIGARSSLFLPFKNLALVIVDEEHDQSYKQEDGILYNARDMAVLRGSISNAKILLCSATPSTETMHNCLKDKYKLVELGDRYNKALLPDISIIDMREEKLLANSYLSPSLIQAIKRNIALNEQSLLFLNRRGYSPLILCRACGFRFTCPSCSAWLVLHKSTKRLECHHCSYVTKIHISCPKCPAENSLTTCGPGVERIEEEVKLLFPDKNIAIISKDQMKKIDYVKELLIKMENNEIDILIGTQLISKGYHFPNLTLVGVIDADLGLVGGDLRAAERTYQLLYQVGGRAGRETKKGKVLLQTFYPENFILNILKNGTQQEFIEAELRNRKEAQMPPFTRMASILLTGKNEFLVKKLAISIAANAPESDARILGPAEALMSKLANKYRYKILVIVDKKFHLQKYLDTWLKSYKIPSSIHLKIDIDPQSFF